MSQFTSTVQSGGGSGGEMPPNDETKAAVGRAEHWDLHIPDLLAVPAAAPPSRPVKKSGLFAEPHGNVYRA